MTYDAQGGRRSPRPLVRGAADLRWVAGLVCVSGLALAVIGLVSYGLWDVLRQYGGQTLSVTASSWFMDFFSRHPIAAFCAGLSTGIMAGHFMWPQYRRTA